MIKEENIPDDWDLKTLDDVGDVITGGTPDTNNDEYWGGDIPWIRITDMNDDLYISDSKDKITKKGLESGSCSLLNEDSVIISTRATIGKVAIASDEIATNQGFKSVETYESILPKFLAYYIMSISDYLNSVGRGATYDEVSKSDMKSIKVPVPPLDEQERIVSVVEERLERVERLEKSVENVGRLADEYRNSLVASLLASNDDLTEEVKGGIPTETDVPDSWEVSEVSDVSKVILGNSPPGETYNENENGPPFIQGASAFGERTPETERFTSEPTKICEEGDTIIAIRATIGDLNIADKKYCLGRGVAGVRAGDEILQEYLHMYLEAIDELDYWREVSTGATFNSITKTNIQELNIPVSPIEVQEEIIDKKDNINFATINKSVGDVSRLFDEYRESVLSHTFQGDINY